MKSSLIIAGILLCAAILLCSLSYVTTHAILEELECLVTQAAQAQQNEGWDACAEAMRELAALWQEKSLSLEIMSLHEDLRNAKGELINARIAAARQNKDEFDLAIGQFRECLAHLRRHESLSLGNLL